MFEQLEKSIIGAILKIKSGKVTPNESNVGRLLDRMKGIDEPAYESLLARYTQAFNEWKKHKGANLSPLNNTKPPK